MAGASGECGEVSRCLSVLCSLSLSSSYVHGSGGPAIKVTRMPFETARKLLSAGCIPFCCSLQPVTQCQILSHPPPPHFSLSPDSLDIFSPCLLEAERHHHLTDIQPLHRVQAAAPHGREGRCVLYKYFSFLLLLSCFLSKRTHTQEPQAALQCPLTHQEGLVRRQSPPPSKMGPIKSPPSC